jgi:protein-tyrosine phosphatase
MIDIHSHILPAQDDGARNMDQAVAMLQMAVQAGTTDIVATPHAGLEYPFDPEVVEVRIRELQAEAGPCPRVHYGCELRLTPERIDDALGNPERYTIAHGRHLLVEFADEFVPKTAGQIFDRMLARRIRPIVAHPERNQILRGRVEELERWVEQGCLLQVTAESLFGRFGNSARESSHTLMRRGLVHFLASDAHDTKHRPPLLDQAGLYMKRQFGEEMFDRLLVENPRAVLEGLDIEPQQPARENSRSWFAFW